MIYTAARQKSRRQQAPIGACCHFLHPCPTPKANLETTKRTGKTEETGTKQEKAPDTANNLATNYLYINKITKFADGV